MNYQFETVNCNICNSDNYTEITNKGQFGFPTNVVICKSCGLVYLNPRWDHRSYMYFYQNEYDKYYRPQIKDTSPLLLQEVNPIEERLKKYDLFPKNVKHILDIGSGKGENLMHFHSLFPEIKLFAIEPSIESQVHLKKSGVDIIDSDVNASWEVNYKNIFDIIIMRHVLEHFLNPVEIMKKVQAVLKPGGIVYVAVPNALITKGDLETFWFRAVHTYYFNKYSLENITRIVGLETLHMIEGDELQQTELYCIATKRNSRPQPEFSVKHFHEQLSYLDKKLKHQKSILNKGIKLIKRILKKLLSLTKNKRH